MTDNQNKPADNTKQDRNTPPSAESVYDYLMYGLSLPERAVRSTAAMIGGLVNESATLLVPQAFRDSTTYSKFVQQMMDMVNENVGGVKRASNSPESDTDVEGYVAKKTVGTFVDLAGMATLHLSPITVLAIFSDLAYGSTSYLQALSSELKKEGVIAEDSTVSSTAELLEAISQASAETTNQLDLPPLSVEGLKKTIQQTQDSISKIDPTKLFPQSEIKRLWADMQSLANREDVSVFEVSSAVTMYSLNQISTVTKGALTTVRVTGNFLDQHLLDHYWQATAKIGQQGIYSVIAESSQPYLDAVWYNFSSQRPTLTEDIVSGKMIGKAWSGLREWFAPGTANE